RTRRLAGRPCGLRLRAGISRVSCRAIRSGPADYAVRCYGAQRAVVRSAGVWPGLRLESVVAVARLSGSTRARACVGGGDPSLPAAPDASCVSRIRATLSAETEYRPSGGSG